MRCESSMMRKWREDFPVGATTNPYGTTKVFTERILTDCCKADPELNVALLRYFCLLYTSAN